LIEDGEYFETVVGYVLLNPVRAGLCRDLLDYRWSSAGASVTDGSCLVERHLLAERVSGRTIAPSDICGQCETLLRWMRRLEVAANAGQIKESIRGTFCGSSQFRKRILLQNERREKFDENRHRRITDQVSETTTWQDWKEIAENICGHVPDSLCSAWRSNKYAVEDIRIYLAHRKGHWTFDRMRKEDGDRFSLARYTYAVSIIEHNPLKSELARIALGR
jgi:hypothetical protein